MRILFYCHNVIGLGHIIRTARIADAASKVDGCECLVVTGCRFLDRIPINPAIRVVALPPLQMDKNLRFRSINGESGDAIIRQRSQRILQVSREWQPDAFLVDHTALGLGGELIETLQAARREKWETRFTWGLRDIQVSPEHVTRSIRPPMNPEIKLAIGQYSGAIAYSDESWINTLESYRAHGLPERSEYVGIVTAAAPLIETTKTPVIVGLSGGGTGGDRLFDLLLQASRPLVDDGSVRLRLVAGPLASASAFDNRVEGKSSIEIWPEGPVEEAIKDASVVVCRVGYNTAYSVVQTSLPVVLVPLPRPGDEQLYRARKLAQLPGVSMIDERTPTAQAALLVCLEQSLKLSRIERRLPFRTDGAMRAANWITKAAIQGKSA